MWYPKNKYYTIETFDQHNTGDFTYSNFDRQNDIGGAVGQRNLITGLNTATDPGQPWPALQFSKSVDFAMTYNSQTGMFFVSGGVPVINPSFNTIGFTGVSNIYYTGNFSLQTGLVVEASFILTNITGTITANKNKYGVFIARTGEGYDTVHLINDPPGFIIGAGLAHQTFVPAPTVENNIVSFRYGMSGSIGQFVTSDGERVIINNRTLGPYTSLASYGYQAANAHMIIGDITLTGNQEATNRVDCRVAKYKYPVFDIVGDFVDDVLYDTNVQTFKTAPFKPQNRVKQWGTLYANLIGNPYGVTTIGVEFTNDGTGFSSTIPIISTSATGLHSGAITGVSINNNDLHQLRVVIGQSSVNGFGSAPSVDDVTLTYNINNDNDLLFLDPSQGPVDGNYPVVISIDRENRSYIKQYDPKGTLFLQKLTGSTSYISESPVKITGTAQSFISGPSSFFGDTSHSFLDIRNCTGDQITGSFGLNKLFYSLSSPVNTVPNSDGFLSTQNFQYLYNTGVTGAVTGIIGNKLAPYFVPTVATGSSIFFTEYIPFHDTGNFSIQYWAAQGYKGPVGGGLALTGLLNILPNNSGMAYEFITQVTKGGLYVGPTGLTGSGPVYTQNRFNEAQRATSIFYTGGVHDLAFIGTDQSGNFTTSDTCEFRIAGVRCFGYYNNLITYSTTITAFITDWVVDMWYKPQGFAETTGSMITNPYLLMATGLIGKQIFGVDKYGFPYYNYEGSQPSQFYTGSFGVQLNKWSHLSWHHDNYTIKCFIDGELCLDATPTTYPVTSTSKLFIGHQTPGAISDIRIRSGDVNQHSIQVFDAYSVLPKFQSEYQFNTGDSFFLYRMDNGTLFDYSTYNNPLIIPELNFNRQKIVRDGEGVFGQGIELGDNAYALSSTAKHFTGNNLHFKGYLAYEGRVHSNNIARVASGSNWAMYFSGDKFHFNYNNSLYSTTDTINTLQYFPFVVNLFTGSSTGHIICHWITGNNTGLSLAFSGTNYGPFTLSGCLRLGHSSDTNDLDSVFIDEFGLWTGKYTGEAAGLAWDSPKVKPLETVTFGSSAIATGNVSHVGVYDKVFLVPELTGVNLTGLNVPVNVSTLAGDLIAYPYFRYNSSRKITLDTGSYELWAESRDKLCKTKSVFRIGNTVPDHGINLAYINGPVFSVRNNLSLIENLGNIPDNFVTTVNSYDVLSAFTGSINSINQFVHTGEIDTDDILVTNIAMDRKEFNVQAPLFYKHKVGGDRFFIYNSALTGAVDGNVIKTLRESIRLIDQDNNFITPEDFPWDLRVSKIRNDAVSLPTGVYNAEILTQDQFLPERSIFIEFNAADQINNYSQIKGYREILNPEPIFRHVKNQITKEETFSTVDTNWTLYTGSYNPGPILTVNQLTGLWNPRVNNIYNRDLQL